MYIALKESYMFVFSKGEMFSVSTKKESHMQQ